jgi:hypothetical protein
MSSRRRPSNEHNEGFHLTHLVHPSQASVWDVGNTLVNI